MPSESDKPDASRRWEDHPGVFEYRLLRTETEVEKLDVRLRGAEETLVNVVAKLDVISDDIAEIKTDAKAASNKADSARDAANTGAWRNFWTAIIGVGLVICTVVGTHLLK